jgi:hypothetical protein
MRGSCVGRWGLLAPDELTDWVLLEGAFAATFPELLLDNNG